MLVVLFACFCATVAVGPARVSSSLGEGGKFVPNIGPKGDAGSCLSAVVSHVALPKTFFLTMITVVPTFTQVTNMDVRFSRFFNKASLLVLINIILSALRRMRDRLLVHRCSNLLGSKEVGNHSNTINTCWLR